MFLSFQANLLLLPIHMIRCKKIPGLRLHMRQIGDCLFKTDLVKT